MKNKALTYALLIVVAVIWYQVFFRVKDGFFGGAENTATVPPAAVVNYQDVHRDTFPLKANYRDPFGAMNENARPRVEPAVTDRIKERSQPVVTKWPKINYYGLVKKTSSTDPLAIIEIDGRKFTLRSGEGVFEDITIRRIWRDSIEVQKGREKRVFSR